MKKTVAALWLLSLVTIGLLVQLYHMNQQIEALQKIHHIMTQQIKALQKENQELRENSRFWNKVATGTGAIVCGVAMGAAAPAASSYTFLSQVIHYLFNLLAPDTSYPRINGGKDRCSAAEGIVWDIA